MSLHEYKVSQEISAQDPPFYALIMAAFRKADTGNLEKLRRAFPLVWLEYTARYNAPGGLLEGEQFVHQLEEYFAPSDGYWEEMPSSWDSLTDEELAALGKEDPNEA